MRGEAGLAVGKNLLHYRVIGARALGHLYLEYHELGAEGVSDEHDGLGDRPEPGRRRHEGLYAGRHCAPQKARAVEVPLVGRRELRPPRKRRESLRGVRKVFAHDCKSLYLC